MYGVENGYVLRPVPTRLPVPFRMVEVCEAMSTADKEMAIVRFHVTVSLFVCTMGALGAK